MVKKQDLLATQELYDAMKELIPEEVKTAVLNKLEVSESMDVSGQRLIE